MTIYLPVKVQQAAANALDISDSHGRIICSCVDVEGDGANLLGDANTIVQALNNYAQNSEGGS